MYRSDRSSRIRGGALLYIRDTLVVSNVKTFDDNTCESVICTIDSMNTIDASIYRPPTASFSSISKVVSHMQDYLDASNNDQKSVYVTGDFNLPNMNWGQLSFRQTLETNNNQACESLLNFMGNKFLNQVVNKNTRNKNTLANNVRDILDVSSDPTSLSDQKVVGINLGYNALANQDNALPKTFENFSFHSLNIHQGDIVALNASLAEIDWQALFDHCNTENDDLNENNEFAELLRLTCSNCATSTAPKRPR